MPFIANEFGIVQLVGEPAEVLLVSVRVVLIHKPSEGDKNRDCILCIGFFFPAVFFDRFCGVAEGNLESFQSRPGSFHWAAVDPFCIDCLEFFSDTFGEELMFDNPDRCWQPLGTACSQVHARVCW